MAKWAALTRKSEGEEPFALDKRNRVNRVNPVKSGTFDSVPDEPAQAPVDPANCSRDYHVVGTPDGRRKQECKLCGKFLGYVKETRR